MAGALSNSSLVSIEKERNVFIRISMLNREVEIMREYVH
jgi:hypothetical protein